MPRFWESGWSRAFKRYVLMYSAYNFLHGTIGIRYKEGRVTRSWRRLCLAMARVQDYDAPPPSEMH